MVDSDDFDFFLEFVMENVFLVRLIYGFYSDLEVYDVPIFQTYRCGAEEVCDI